MLVQILLALCAVLTAALVICVSGWLDAAKEARAYRSLYRLERAAYEREHALRVLEVGVFVACVDENERYGRLIRGEAVSRN